MARLIVNEGAGPRPVELSGERSLGSNPACDVVLTHPTALGTRVVLKPLRFGYRATAVKGQLLVNGQPRELADLEHNDQLRIGEVLVIYKQPEGEAFRPEGGAPADGPVELELLPDAEPAAELSEAELRELAGEELPLLEDAEPVRRAAEVVGLDEALQRSRWKRLEALRRLQVARAGGAPEGPDLAAPGALDAVAALDADAVAALESMEWSQGLMDAPIPLILERARDTATAKAAESAEAARRAAEQAEAERRAAEAERQVAERAAAERAAAERAEAERLAAAEAAARAAAEAETRAAEAARDDALRRATEDAERARLAEAPPADVELEVLETLDTLEPLEALDTLDLVELTPWGDGPLVASAATAGAAAGGPRRPLPAGGVRFTRPLPPGHRAPRFLPPVHPGRPPA